MKKYSRLAVLLIASGLLFGCERSHDIDVDSVTRFSIVLFQHPVVGVTKTRECNLLPDNPVFREVADWFSENRGGWGDYIATPAVGGALISGNGFSLNVYESSFVLAFTDRGGKLRQLHREKSTGELDSVFSLPCESSDTRLSSLETLTYLPQLMKVSPDSLSAQSKEILSAAIRVIEIPASGEAELAYLSVFPKTFSEFRAVFQPEDYSELYSVYFELIGLFRVVSMSHPTVASPIYVSLIRGVCFDVDAPSYFVDAWNEFRLAHAENYLNSAESLLPEELRRTELLKDVSVHDWTPKEIMCE